MSPGSARLCVAVTAVTLATMSDVDSRPLAPEHHCRTVDTATVRRVRVDLRPNYFLKVVPGTGLVALATSDGNVLLDLSTDVARVIRVPGNYDPIPSSPDGRMVSVSDGQLRLYSLVALLRDGVAARPFFVSERVLMTGVYQSVARLGPAQPRATYAVAIVSNHDGLLRVQDLEVQFDGDEPVGAVEKSAPQRLCTNLERNDVSLPMLSKDGREIALLVGQSTKIFRISGTRCEQVLDLGIATGKVDFSFDGRQLLFHLGANERASTSDGGVPWQRARLRPWLYDRDAAPGTSPLRFISVPPRGNAYYPVFTKQGSIIYLHAAPHGDTVEYSFVHAARPDAAVMKSAADGRGAVALGRLWLAMCAEDHEQNRIFPLEAVAKNLDPATCRRLVDAHWSKFRLTASRDAVARVRTGGDFSRLDEADVRAACPQ